MRKKSSTPSVLCFFVVMSGLPIALPVYGDTESAMGTGQDELTLAATGSASIEINPRSGILAGSYSGGFPLATWQAEVTEGTLAFRLNPTVVGQYATPTYLGGYIWNTPRTQNIEIEMTHNCGTAKLTNTWRVCPSGTMKANGTLVTTTNKLQTLVGGTYSVALDAVVWTF